MFRGQIHIPRAKQFLIGSTLVLLLSCLVNFSQPLYGQDTFVIEGDTITFSDDDWYEIILTGGEGEGIYWLKDISRKEIPVYYRFYSQVKEVEYMQFGIAKEKEFIFHGPGRFFYPDGELQGKIFFNYGNLEGVLSEYYEDGQLALLANYQDDLEEGLHKTFYENGQLWEDNVYASGGLEGMQKSYYPNGKLESEIEFLDDIPQGTGKTYYDNGQLRSEIGYEEGEPHGVETIYFPDGKIWSKREYQYGLLVNVESLLSPEGDSLEIGTFGNGYGTLNVYDEMGELVEQSVYRKGTEVRRIMFKEEEPTTLGE